MDPLSRKVVQVDVVQYKLFLIQSDDTDSQTHEERLKHSVDDILARIAPLLMKYIWQHQSFNLNYQPGKEAIPAHIGGTTLFGDNVEDELFIVYLLQHITEAFPELAARVEDNDGEFLLIEAVDYLPKWLSPETSENRGSVSHPALPVPFPCSRDSQSRAAHCAAGFSSPLLHRLPRKPQNLLRPEGTFEWGQMEGSVHYKGLMTSAENFFRLSFTHGGQSAGEEVLLLLQNSAPFNLEELKQQ